MVDFHYTPAAWLAIANELTIMGLIELGRYVRDWADHNGAERLTLQFSAAEAVQIRIAAGSAAERGKLDE